MSSVIQDGKDRRMGENALSTLLLLIKSKFVPKELKTGSQSAYKTLSDNDLTDALKANYDAAYTHSQSAHAPANAEQNVIESVKVNGTALTVENKAVDVPVPLISTDISADSASNAKTASAKAVYDYVASTIAGVASISFRILTSGEYNSETLVPTVTGSASYIYLVPITGATNNIYKEFIFVNNAFECIGSTEVDLSGYIRTTDLVEFSAAEVQAIWTGVFSA